MDVLLCRVWQVVRFAPLCDWTINSIDNRMHGQVERDGAGVSSQDRGIHVASFHQSRRRVRFGHT